MNDDNAYLWVSLLMAVFSRPGTMIDPEKVRANMDDIKRIVKEANIDFYSTSFEEMEEKSQKVYDLVEEYLS